ncbi:helix-hairpin-helix domain-containing protein [Pseudomonas sp. P66]|uniref:Helix-hairpin-helix domain-containing protein n=1 Tax=Pseudomonas arcuscaelestis TaxID=2710591 RepID=A0ABS2C181_9PSED|nr:hypothetical protein [Pseudomonas arcuscaelestis]MBM5458809.1 helix-hairpin-helix domain-containing protein [Pseudomonas arcuscaelestis]
MFTLKGSRDSVAKIYHAPIDREKQIKLTHMTGAHDAQLLKYAAWPLATLHERAGGTVIGFTMEKVGGMKPIQSLYSPAQRKQEFPQRGWDFLLVAARNTAAAFTVLHERGFVVGDVNHGNLYLGQKATVKLIDTDSYQLHDGNSLHLCEVGVSTYTPPELQGASFRGVTRTPNHDNFGLSLLIWHLLMGGRHPFAGVPQQEGVGETIEENITACRFAYSNSDRQRLLLPPPNSLPITTLPPSVVAMFEQAFTKSGVSAGRPTAQQWLEELDEMRTALRPCVQSKMHTYPAHLNACPWCELERKGVVYFVNAPVYSPGADAGGAQVRVEDIWAAICKVPAMSELRIPPASQPNPEPEPLPLGVYSTTAKRYLGLGITAVTLAIWAVFGGISLLYFTLIGLTWIGLVLFGANAKLEEQKRREEARELARRNYEAAVTLLRREDGGEQTAAKRELLHRLKLELDGLATREQKEFAKLRSNAEKRQRTAFLERYYIEKAFLPALGPAKRAALQSFGIETAAEVDAGRIRQVKGFGESLTRVLVEWRAGHERNFRFNPATAITPADSSAVKRAIQTRATEIQALMQQGLKDLQQGAVLRDKALRRHGQAVQIAANKLAQAEADWKALL